jgi:hypothetical protein
MIEEGTQNINAFHLAGIVPIAGQPLEFGFPWHDSLMPIAQDYMAIEHAVQECAMAGCETIWVVCHNDTQSLIRHRVGEWILDPAARTTGLFASEEERRIPIFYVPIHPKDRHKRDCLGWSVLYGALTAYHMSKALSKWVIPDKYYAAFPYGVYSLEIVKENRDKFSTSKTYCLTHDGRSIKTGHHLGFTFGAEDFKKCRRIIRKESTLTWTKEGKKIPLKERYSARYFPLDKVFKGAIIDEEIEIKWQYDIDTWNKYVTFLSSDESKEISKPKKMKYNEWNPIGYDEEKDV